MAFRLSAHGALGDEFLRVIRQTIDGGCEKTKPGLPLADRIHRARTTCKKLRAALRLVREVDPDLIRREDRVFQDAAHTIGRFRDADAVIAAHGLLFSPAHERPAPRESSAIRRRLVAHRAQLIRTKGETGRAFAAFHAQLRGARRRLNARSFQGVKFSTVASGWADTYREARQAMKWADKKGDASSFHRWRRRSKTHGYHCRLLRKAWPGVMQRLGKEVEALGELLGQEHDLVLLSDFLRAKEQRDLPAAPRAALLTLIATRRRELQRAARDRGRRIYADSPATVECRLRRWWKVARHKAGRAAAQRGRRPTRS